MTPPAANWRFWVFLGAVTGAGATVTALAVPALAGPSTDDASLLVILSILLLLNLGSIVGRRVDLTHGLSSTLMFEFALIVHWGAAGLAVAILVQTFVLIIGDWINHRAPWRTVFNAALYAVTMGTASLALLAFGLHGSLATPETIEPLTLLAILVAGVLSLVVNFAVADGMVAMQFNNPWWPGIAAMGPGLLPAAVNDGAALALAPLVVLAAERGPWLVPLLLIPLLAVYQGDVASRALKHQAGHDALTGLPNRAYLLDRVAEVLPGTSGQEAVALFVLDLDRFKDVNDSLGHPAGDRLLKVVAERLLAAVRPGDVVARLGGDEFAVLLTGVLDEASMLGVADRIDDALRAPLRLGGVTLRVSSSLGMAVSPEHGSDFETLMKHADVAMYSAKGRGTAHETYAADLTPVAELAQRKTLSGGEPARP